MGQMKAVFDTNILIDYLNGIDQAREEIARYTDPAISVIAWIEVLVGAKDPNEDNLIRSFLRRFETIYIERDISERAVAIRQTQRLRLPDAIILATAQHHNALLVTRNTKDFSPDAPQIRLPYEL